MTCLVTSVDHFPTYSTMDVHSVLPTRSRIKIDVQYFIFIGCFHQYFQVISDLANTI